MKRSDIINDPQIGNRSEAYEAWDDIPTNPNLGNTTCCAGAIRSLPTRRPSTRRTSPRPAS